MVQEATWLGVGGEGLYVLVPVVVAVLVFVTWLHVKRCARGGRYRY